MPIVNPRMVAKMMPSPATSSVLSRPTQNAVPYVDAAELNALSGQVDLENKSIDEVAATWIKDNESKWRAWAE